MKLALKYGCNLNQKPSRIYMEDGSDSPAYCPERQAFRLLSIFSGCSELHPAGHELARPRGLPAAASFKHVSRRVLLWPAPTDVERRCTTSPRTWSFAGLRRCPRRGVTGCPPRRLDRSSDVCDVPTAKLIQHEVSDGIIAPGYEPEALTILAGKKKGNYNVVAIDPAYKPNPVEHKQVYGITFEQGRNELAINADTMLTNWVTENKTVTEEQKRDLIIALITLKYTQSNSVCYTAGGQTIGVGAGQQSRIHCTRLAGQKADNWQLRHMPKVLELPSVTMWQSPTATTPLMFTSATPPRTSSVTTSGPRPSPVSPSR